MKIAVIGVAALLTGCAHVEALAIGNGNYSLTATAQLGFGSSRQEAVDDANEFCAKQHKSAIVTSFSDAGPQAFVGYSTSVVFRCEGTH